MPDLHRSQKAQKGDTDDMIICSVRDLTNRPLLIERESDIGSNDVNNNFMKNNNKTIREYNNSLNY